MNEQDTTQINGAFHAMLQTHRGGAALNDIADAMLAATDAARTVGKPASFTVKFTVTPAGTDGALMLDDDISTKLPRAPKRTSIFFANPETGALQRDNPNQMKLGLKIVGETVEEAPLRTAVAGPMQ